MCTGSPKLWFACKISVTAQAGEEIDQGETNPQKKIARVVFWLLKRSGSGLTVIVRQVF
jgi:hypothetical protein